MWPLMHRLRSTSEPTSIQTNRSVKVATQPNDHSRIISRRIRRLAWLTIALALAPMLGLVLAGLFEAIVPPNGHNPFLASGRPWMALLMVFAITAPAHVPYVAVLCITAWGLFRHRPWARIMTLVLTPFALGLMLLFGGGIVDALFNVLVKGVRDSSVKLRIVAFSPLTLTSAVYCLYAHLLLWNAQVREVFKLPSDRDSPQQSGH